MVLGAASTKVGLDPRMSVWQKYGRVSRTVLETTAIMNPVRLRKTERGPNSPRSELQKAVCGWGGAQLQALLEAISDSNKRMPEARDAKGAILVSAGKD